jgi:hypothetical protein
MYDGSFDDFIDGASCSSIVLPAIAKVNGSQVTFFVTGLSTSYFYFRSINNDQDSVVLQFPLRVKQVTIQKLRQTIKQSTILNACSTAEASGQGAITSLNINFPITILTYNKFTTNRGVVITSEKQLFTYMSNVSSTELFSVNYPITVTLAGGTDATVNSDAELQSNINASLTQATITQAEENSKKLETILVDGRFKVQSFITAGVDSANYKDSTVDFANDGQ